MRLGPLLSPLPELGPADAPSGGGGAPELSPMIQPHGWLVVVDPEDLRIRQVSANCAGLADASAEALIGRPLTALLGRRATALLRRAMRQSDGGTVGPVDCQIQTPHHRFGAWLQGHPGVDGLVLEIEASPPLEEAASFLAGVGSAIRRYRAADDVDRLAQAVARDVRRLTGFPQTIVIRLGAGEAVVVASDTARDSGPPPSPGAPFHTEILNAQTRAVLERNRTRTVPDTLAEPVALVPACNPATGLPLDLGRSALRVPTEPVLRLARREGLRSVMAISLVAGGRLWGVIWCEDREPRHTAPAVRALCEAVGEIAAAQISALEERALANARLAAAQTLSRLAARLRADEDLAVGLDGAAAEIAALFAPDAWTTMVDGTVRARGNVLPAARWKALLDGPAAVRQDGIVHAVAGGPEPCAALRIDIAGGGHLVLLRREARPWTIPQLEAASDLHRMLVERHAELYREAAERRLHRLAYYDPVTDLPNRSLLLQELQRIVAGGGDAALLAVGLSRFKELKGTLGEASADLLMAAVARRLEGCIGPGDWLARLDTGEFGILIRVERGADAAARTSSAIREALKAPLAVGEREVFVTPSLGLVPSARAHGLAADVLHSAEIAAYEAEASGGGTRSFESAMRAKLTERYELYDRLRHAIYVDDAIQAAFQPIVDLDSGALTGFEVLARWTDPERGSVPPAEFIPVAEETGLIAPLGNQILVQGCRAVAAWNRVRLSADPYARPLTVSVNLSPVQLSSAKLDLVRWVSGVLELTGAEPHWLVLEITESGLIASPNCLEALGRLRELGIRLSIDDFGTGYSSLSYLQRLPVQTIKIDRSFIQEMERSPKGMEMVRTIVQLARIMGFGVIAEGVETASQANALRGLGCGCAQGYLFARPLARDQADRLVADTPSWAA